MKRPVAKATRLTFECITHQHNNIFHVLILLRVKESSKLLFVGFHVIVLVGHLESPLIPSHHLFVAEAVIRILIIW